MVVEVTTNKQFVDMMGDRLDENVLYICFEVRENGLSGEATNDASAHSTSRVTGQSTAQSEAKAAIAMSPEQQRFSHPESVVDWSTLTIITNDDQDGEAIALAYKDVVFEVFGFKAAEEAAT